VDQLVNADVGCSICLVVTEIGPDDRLNYWTGARMAPEERYGSGLIDLLTSALLLLSSNR
jgi:hypothetical protein